jgi:uroporphyrinogen decarboxylase
MITPKQNILMAYNKKEPHWIPSHYLDQNTCVYSANEEGVQGFGESIDCFGVHWIYNEGDEGPMTKPGTKLIKDIENWEETVKFPDLKDWNWDTAAAKDTSDWDRKNKISSVVIINGLFEQLHVMTGMEDALCYLLTNPKEVYEFFKTFANWRIKQIYLIAQYYKPDKIQFHDDYGDNHNTLMSPETWRALIKPHLKRIVEACHQNDLLFEQHSDGYIVPLVEDFIEIGIDALNPIQICNDPITLKKKYQDRLCFVGGFDNQGVLEKPGVTYQKQLDEIRYRIKEMSPGGSWVAHPIMLNPQTGLVLVDALYEHNLPLMKKVGYSPPPKPTKAKINAYTKGYQR